MNNTAFVAILMVFSLLTFNASAQESRSKGWVMLGNSTCFLTPKEGKPVYLSASIDTRTNDVAINIMDLGGKFCKEGETSSNVEKTSPIKINNKYIKFLSGCINGIQILQPETDAGKQFLNSAVFSGLEVVVETGFDLPLHYPRSDIARVRDQLLAAEKAM